MEGMEDEEIVFQLPSQDSIKQPSSRRVLRSSCIGTKCICVSKGLKHHGENNHSPMEDNEEKGDVLESFLAYPDASSSLRGTSSYTYSTTSTTSKYYTKSSFSGVESSSRLVHQSSPSSYLGNPVGTSSFSQTLPSSVTGSSYLSKRRSSNNKATLESNSFALHSKEKEGPVSSSSGALGEETIHSSSFPKEDSPDTSSFSDSLDSPRHRIFKDLDNWINSPRTGYTYAESETYGSETESKFEVPMPHMARKPIRRDVKNSKSFTTKNVNVKVKTQSSLWSSVRRIFRKVFYEIPASLLIFDTKLLLKSPCNKDNVFIKGLLSLWTILCVYPVQLISNCASSIIRLPKALMFRRKENIIQEETTEAINIANTQKKSFGLSSIVKLRQSLALASKRYRLRKLKEAVPKVHKKRGRSYGPPTRRSRRLRGIAAEKYELPRKWRRRMKKRKSALVKVQTEDHHFLTDLWYSLISLFSLSSYTEDDDSDSETESSVSENETMPLHQKKKNGIATGSKPNRVFYFMALILGYLRMPLDVIGNTYHDFRMFLARKIAHLFDRNKDFDDHSEDSDSDEDDGEEDDLEEDLEDFIEKRYLIQDISTYLISLASQPRRISTNQRHRLSKIKHSTSGRTRILRHKYKGKQVSGASAELSDSDDSEVQVTFSSVVSPPVTKAASTENTSSITSRLRKRVSKLFSFAKNEAPSPNQQVELPGIVLSSDEEVISVIQAPKLYTTSRSSNTYKSSVKETGSSSWKAWLMKIMFFPWNKFVSCLGMLKSNGIKEHKTSKGVTFSNMPQENIFRRCGSSVYNGLRNFGLLLGSLCIYACIPLIHGTKKFLSLFNSTDEVDRNVFEISEEEYADEGFDSLNDEEFEREVINSNMKLFSSQLNPDPSLSQGKAKQGNRCQGWIIPLLLCLLLIPLSLYGLSPLINSSDSSAPAIKWISSTSAEYLDGVKVLQNRVQESGKAGWLHVKNGLLLLPSKFYLVKDSFISMGSSLSGGFSSHEKSLRKYFSGFRDMMYNLLNSLQKGFFNSWEFVWSFCRAILKWIRDISFHYGNKIVETLSYCKDTSSSLVAYTSKSIGERLMSIPVFFSSMLKDKSGGGSVMSSVQHSGDDALSPTPTLKKDHLERNGHPKPSQLSTDDYEAIVEKIISNEKFKELAKTSSEDENEIIKSSKQEIVKIMNDQEDKHQKEYSELKALLLQQKEILDAHQESYESWKKEIEKVFETLQVEIQSLSNDGSGDLSSQQLLKELQDKILALEENSHKLFNLSSNCCGSIDALDIEGQVKAYFQDSNGEDLLHHMKKVFISKEENSNRLAKLKSDVLDKLETLKSGKGDSSPLDIDSIHRVVEKALIRYDADKTGKFDYALESAGGSVISTRCTETYIKKTALYTIFGIPLWYPSNNPRTAIQPGVHPGECWAFKGSEGFLVVHLSSAIIPHSFSIEHIPKSMSPTGSIDSAPKDFIVLGLKTEKDPEPVHLGKYSYSSTGDPLQLFDIQTPSESSFDIIELVIRSNHGNVNFTCLYRFRVHGYPIHS